MRIAQIGFFAGLLALPSFAHAQVVVLPGTQPGALQQPLVAAAQCAECHSGLQTSDARNYMPGDLWPSSIHGNSARDPLFLATLSVAEQDVPTIGQYCLRCHSPSGFTGGRALPGTGAMLDPLAGDLDGVHCDTCHRSIDARARDPMAPYAGNARLFFEDAPSPALITRHGPRNDPFMSNRHESIGDPFTSDSRMCGQCHEVDNPLVHRLTPAGVDTGAPFPLQSTFSEWRQSDFARRMPAQSCQGCHMPSETESLPATRIPNAPMRASHRRHDFVGANEWQLAALRAAYPGENDEGYDALRARTRTFLQTAARLEIVDAPAEATAGATVRVTVRVTNLSGHKFPTGYEDAKLAWLQIDAGSTTVSGAFTNDELVEDTQLRAYRFVAGHFEGGRLVQEDHVALHNVVMEDTRIPAEGMMSDARTAPVGRDYSGGAGGALRHQDTAVFDVPVGAATGPLTITVRLLYQATTKHYVETIAADNRTGDGRGERLLAAWRMSGRGAPFAVATTTATIQVNGGSNVDAGTSTDADINDASSADGGTMTTPGCRCTAAGSTSGNGAMGGIGMLGLLAVVRARRRRR